MNGVHDMGGMQGMGPIDVEENDVPFHDDWERSMFGMFMTLFPTGIYNIDELRHGTERMGATKYLNTSYYEHWLSGIQTMLLEKGILTEDEISARMRELGGGAT